MQLVQDFYAAGAETTATTLGWALYFMIKYNDVQTKVRVSCTQHTEISHYMEVKGSRPLCVFGSPFTHSVSFSRMKLTLWLAKVARHP